MGVGRDGEEPVGAAVAAAPDLRPVRAVRAQDVQAGVREGAGSGGRSTGHSWPGSEGAEQRTGDAGVDHRPPGARADGAGAAGEEHRPRVGVGLVEDERSALVPVSLPRRAAGRVEHCCGRVQGTGEEAEGLLAERVPRGPGLDEAHEPELGDEAVVVGGQLPVETAREGVRPQPAFQLSGGLCAPHLALGEPREGARRGEQPHRLGHHVVVRGGALAAKRRQVLLVPTDLGQGLRVLLEQLVDARPVVEQAADPHPARQSHAELDPAGPVDAGEERVAGPPGAQLGGDRLGVAVLAGEPPGGREHRKVVVAGQFPHGLDVPRQGLVTVVDAERQRAVRRSPAGDRVAEPVRVHDVGSWCTQDLPVAGQQPVRSGDHPAPGLRRHLRPDLRRNRTAEAPCRQQSRHGRECLARPHLPPPPTDLTRPVTDPEEKLLRGHPQEPSHVPAGRPAHGASGRPETRLSPTAIVARVVATSDARPIGMAAPSRTASRKASSCARWPLSCPV